MIEEKSPSEAKDDTLFEEMSNLTLLINGQEWGTFCNVMRKHKDYLNKQVMRSVRRGEHREADRFQAKFEEIDVIHNQIMARMKELQKGRK